MRDHTELMRKAFRKLQKTKGESIAEILVAMLVIAMGLIMLASMLTASVNMIKNSKEQYTTEVAQKNAVESSTELDIADLTLTISGSSGDMLIGVGTDDVEGSGTSICSLESFSMTESLQPVGTTDTSDSSTTEYLIFGYLPNSSSVFGD